MPTSVAVSSAELNPMGRELKRVFLEALAIAVLGLAFALVANLVSPRGLSLARNYFPGTRKAVANPVPVAPGRGTNNSVSVPGGGPGRVSATSTAAATVTVQDPVTARLKEEGLHPVDGKTA